jgi:hypothetical protein
VIEWGSIVALIAVHQAKGRLRDWAEKLSQVNIVNV